MLFLFPFLCVFSATTTERGMSGVRKAVFAVRQRVGTPLAFARLCGSSVVCLLCAVFTIRLAGLMETRLHLGAVLYSRSTRVHVVQREFSDSVRKNTMEWLYRERGTASRCMPGIFIAKPSIHCPGTRVYTCTLRPGSLANQPNAFLRKSVVNLVKSCSPGNATECKWHAMARINAKSKNGNGEG